MNRFVLVALGATLSAEDVLAILDGRLSVGDEGSAHVANVLSAIRGIDKPASEREPIKAVSTAVIRAKAFPATYAAKLAGATRLGWEMVSGDTVETTGNVADGHFNRHIKQAAKRLGLTVKVGTRRR